MSNRSAGSWAQGAARASEPARSRTRSPCRAVDGDAALRAQPARQRSIAASCHAFFSSLSTRTERTSLTSRIKMPMVSGRSSVMFPSASTSHSLARKMPCGSGDVNANEPVEKTPATRRPSVNSTTTKRPFGGSLVNSQSQAAGDTEGVTAVLRRGRVRRRPQVGTNARRREGVRCPRDRRSRSLLHAQSRGPRPQHRQRHSSANARALVPFHERPVRRTRQRRSRAGSAEVGLDDRTD